MSRARKPELSAGDREALNRAWDEWQDYDRSLSDVFEDGFRAALGYRKLAPAQSVGQSAAQAEEALFRIAFQHDTNALGGDPSKWPSIIAYRALGGRIIDGQHADTEAALRARLSALPKGQEHEG